MHPKSHSITASQCKSNFTQALQHEYLQSRSITAAKWISEFTRSWSPSACPNSLDYRLPVDVWVTQTPPPSSSLSYMILVSKCILKVFGTQPPNASLSSLNVSLQVHLQTGSIMASRSIFGFSQSRPSRVSPNSHSHSCGMYLCIDLIAIFRHPSNGSQELPAARSDLPCVDG